MGGRYIETPDDLRPESASSQSELPERRSSFLMMSKRIREQDRDA
jgi:hypothetical protein